MNFDLKRKNNIKEDGKRVASVKRTSETSKKNRNDDFLKNGLRTCPTRKFSTKRRYGRDCEFLLTRVFPLSSQLFLGVGSEDGQEE